MKNGICIYHCETRTCDNAHVFPEALGGMYSSDKAGITLECKDCNSSFGSGIDAHLVDFLPFALTRNLFRIKGRNGHVPLIEVNDYYTRQKYILFPQWKLRKAQSPVEVIEQQQWIEGETGHRRCAARVTAQTEATGRRQVRKWAQSVVEDLWSEGFRDVIPQISTTVDYSIEHTLGLDELSVRSFDDEDFRAITKIAFNYLATKLGIERILSQEFAPVRAYIKDGYNPQELSFCWLEYRDLYDLPASKFPLYHRVTLFLSPETMNIFAVVEFFELFKFRVSLLWSYEGPKKGYFLLEDPINQTWEEGLLSAFTPVPVRTLMQEAQNEIDEIAECYKAKVNQFHRFLDFEHEKVLIKDLTQSYFSDPLIFAFGNMEELFPHFVKYIEHRTIPNQKLRLMRNHLVRIGESMIDHEFCT